MKERGSTKENILEKQDAIGGKQGNRSKKAHNKSPLWIGLDFLVIAATPLFSVVKN